jgi:hypothetical protein
MSKTTCSLNDVKVAAPCTVAWDEMIGDDQVRFCGQCKLNVYNLSGMSRDEAESLIARTEGRLCIRFYRRTDGRILTRNCPVGLRAIKARISRVTRATVSAALSFFAGVGIYTGLREQDYSKPSKDDSGYSTTLGVMAVTPPEQRVIPPGSKPVMGQPEPMMGEMEISSRNSVKPQKHRAR